MRELEKKFNNNYQENLLILKDPKLNTIPYELIEKTGITELELYCDQITEVTEEILRLQSLERLIIKSDNLLYLSPFVFKLPKLKTLIVKNASLQELLEITPTAPLEKLFLNHCQLEILPDFVSQIKTIKELSLIGNFIQEIPESFKNLKELKRLTLDQNNIKEMPLCLFSMTELGHLSIDKNPLTQDIVNQFHQHFKILPLSSISSF